MVRGVVRPRSAKAQARESARQGTGSSEVTDYTKTARRLGYCFTKNGLSVARWAGSAGNFVDGGCAEATGSKLR
jgi:hypothetical protein